MNLIITKWLLVYVLENKHTFYVIRFLSLTVYSFQQWRQLVLNFILANLDSFKADQNIRQYVKNESDWNIPVEMDIWSVNSMPPNWRGFDNSPLT